MIIFEKISKQNRVKIHTKTHEIAPFKKIFLGGACFATCKFPNLKKKNSWPPFQNPGYALGGRSLGPPLDTCLTYSFDEILSESAFSLLCCTFSQLTLVSYTIIKN